nr:sugar ABC transporter permease [Butyrivibrio sp.]
MTKEKKKILQAIPFMLPSFIGMIIFSFLPIIMATALSMTDWSGLEKFTIHTIPDHFVGFQNYIQLLTREEFWSTLLHVLYYIVLYIPLGFLLSMVIALVLNTEKRFTGVMRVLFYIPVLTSWVAASLIWKWVLSSQYGVINSIIGVF